MGYYSDVYFINCNITSYAGLQLVPEPAGWFSLNPFHRSPRRCCCPVLCSTAVDKSGRNYEISQIIPKHFNLGPQAARIPCSRAPTSKSLLNRLFMRNRRVIQGPPGTTAVKCWMNHSTHVFLDSIYGQVLALLQQSFRLSEIAWSFILLLHMLSKSLWRLEISLLAHWWILLFVYKQSHICFFSLMELYMSRTYQENISSMDRFTQSITSIWYYITVHILQYTLSKIILGFI